MSYKVLYRKYRPKSFSEVAGQKAIVQTLSNALKSGKISHAYLFAGPRGTGKTTMAKLFAKAINCEKGNGEICNTCDNCLSANNNTHPDIIEIDAASNNGVEEVRSLIEKVKFAPIKGKYKIYIIDEVHMMSSAAFNALLKTLEEPPAHVIFILATTEPHKVLPTILSRCQRYDFSKIEENAIRDYLCSVLDKEGVTYEPDALKPIVDIADGGMRDALMMLDQVLSYTNKKISTKDVLDLFGIASMEEKINLLIDIANKDTNKVMARSNKFLESGVDITRLSFSLLEILKDLLIYHITKEYDLLNSLKEKEVKQIDTLFSDEVINQMIEILLNAMNQFQYVNNPRSLFEITILKLLTLNTSSKKVEIKTEIKEEKPTEVKKEIEVKKEEAVIKPSIEDAAPLKSEGSTNSLNDEMIIKLMVAGDRDMRLKLLDKWQSSLTSLIADPAIGKYATLLLDATPYIITNNVLIINYDFEKLAVKANIKDNQKVLQRIIETITNKKLFIYALYRAEEIRLKNLFLNLRQLNKLPAKEDIQIKEEEL